MRVLLLIFVLFLFLYPQKALAGQSMTIDSIKVMKSLYQVRNTSTDAEPCQPEVLELKNLVVLSSDFKVLRIYTHSIEKYSFELGELYWEHGYGYGKYWTAKARMDSGQASKVVAFQIEGELQWLRIDFLSMDYSVTFVRSLKNYLSNPGAPLTSEILTPTPALFPAKQGSSGLSFVPPK